MDEHAADRTAQLVALETAYNIEKLRAECQGCAALTAATARYRSEKERLEEPLTHFLAVSGQADIGDEAALEKAKECSGRQVGWGRWVQRLVRAFGIGVLPMTPAALPLESIAHRDMKDELYDAHIEYLKQDTLFQLFAHAMTAAFKEMLAAAATAATEPVATGQQTLQSAVGTATAATTATVPVSVPPCAITRLRAFSSQPSLERLQSAANAVRHASSSEPD
jgi:hypothetical protein